LSPDGIERRFISEPVASEDESAREGVQRGDWDKVGVMPVEIEDIALSVLRRYRSGCVNSSVSICIFIDPRYRRNYVRPVVLPEARKRTASVCPLPSTTDSKANGHEIGSTIISQNNR